MSQKRIYTKVTWEAQWSYSWCAGPLGSRGPGSRPGWVIVIGSLSKHFTLTGSISTQEYKWVQAICQGV